VIILPGDAYRDSVDMDLVREAAAVLNGVHDFKAFTTPRALEEKPADYLTLRDMEVTVEPGTKFLSAHVSPLADQCDYWNFVFKSRSFLYRQASSFVTSFVDLTLPYLTAKACYRLALMPPVVVMCVLELTCRLLEPLGVFSKLHCSCLNSPGTKKCFPNCFCPVRAPGL